jgi:hypothetical protein
MQKDFKNDVSKGVNCSSVTDVTVMDAKKMKELSLQTDREIDRQTERRNNIALFLKNITICT